MLSVCLFEIFRPQIIRLYLAEQIRKAFFFLNNAWEEWVPTLCLNKANRCYTLKPVFHIFNAEKWKMHNK